MVLIKLLMLKLTKSIIVNLADEYPKLTRLKCTNVKIPFLPKIPNINDIILMYTPINEFADEYPGLVELNIVKSNVTKLPKSNVLKNLICYNVKIDVFPSYPELKELICSLSLDFFPVC